MKTPAYIYQLFLIRLLLVFYPEVLFQKINELSWYKNMLINWTANLPLSGKHRLLEIGCSTGELSRHMAKRGTTVTALDYSSVMLDKARRYDTQGIEFTRADAEHLPYANNSFDGVIAASLLNVVKNPSSVLAEMIRVCKTGGYISVLVPNIDMSRTQVDRLVYGLNLQGFSKAALLTWHRFARKTSVNEILKLFIEAGTKELHSATELEGMVITVTVVKP
jgi:ubiquinone/menaquinone biosynthesis C-methylase UbiE